MKGSCIEQELSRLPIPMFYVYFLSEINSPAIKNRNIIMGVGLLLLLYLITMTRAVTQHNVIGVSDYFRY